ncbi:hypothetical protein DB346_06745 [Verrucomicrobia bacterium LW23]|nr:hypothetical protein DB346_06745 [Verrucomicrobia bacterium LW23]
MEWMTFPALALPGLRHGFSLRAPGIPREELDAHLRPALAAQGYPVNTVVEAEQTHSALVAFVREVRPAPPGAPPSDSIHGAPAPTLFLARSEAPAELTPAGRVPVVDALVTMQPGVPLIVRVADCGPVLLYDPVRRAIAVAHSGRKGTEGRITEVTIRAMREYCGTDPRDLIVQLGPCIRPPHYEVAFAEEIGRQARAAGVVHYHDCELCTGCDLERFYSYRLELGKTGRMWGALMLE